ncbi:Uncharacterized protein APZ42_005721, partial [Daphnia magna]
LFLDPLKNCVSLFLLAANLYFSKWLTYSLPFCMELLSFPIIPSRLFGMLHPTRSQLKRFLDGLSPYPHIKILIGKAFM